MPIRTPSPAAARRAVSAAHLSLGVILAAFLIAGSLYALYTPAWQAPDEPAHYNYVRQVAAGELPVLEPGDYNQAYQQQVIDSGFDPRYSVEPFSYEDYQPPLYYMAAAPVFVASDGSLGAMRLLSLLFGVAVVVLAYAIGRELAPDRPWLALTAAAFVAFLPQHLAMLAAVNNDSLAELLVAAILYVSVRYVLAPRRMPDPAARRRSLALWLGVLLGLGFLTKVTVYLMAPVAGLALLAAHWGDWPRLARQSARVFLPALLLGGLWWVRNAAVYGGGDVLGTITHNEIVVGQPRTADWIAQRGLGPTVQAFARTTFQSFWGQFGWMGVPMPAWVYALLLLFTVLTALGLAWAAVRYRRGQGRAAETRPVMLVLGATVLLSIALYLGYNVTFVQHQGRYLFSALIPIALAIAVAWATLLAPLMRRGRAAYLLPLGLGLALFLLDLLALFRFIVPELA